MFLLQLLIVICCFCCPANAIVVFAFAIAVDCCLLLHHNSNQKVLALAPKSACWWKTVSLQRHDPPVPHCNDAKTQQKPTMVVKQFPHWYCFFDHHPSMLLPLPTEAWAPPIAAASSPTPMTAVVLFPAEISPLRIIVPSIY